MDGGSAFCANYIGFQALIARKKSIKMTFAQLVITKLRISMDIAADWHSFEKIIFFLSDAKSNQRYFFQLLLKKKRLINLGKELEQRERRFENRQLCVSRQNPKKSGENKPQNLEISYFLSKNFFRLEIDSDLNNFRIS